MDSLRGSAKMHTCTTLPAYLNIKIQNICIIGHDFANCKNSVFIFYLGNTFIKANCNYPLLLNGVLKPFVSHLYLKPSLSEDIYTEVENLTKSIYAQQRILYSESADLYVSDGEGCHGYKP